MISLLKQSMMLRIVILHLMLSFLTSFGNSAPTHHGNNTAWYMNAKKSGDDLYHVSHEIEELENRLDDLESDLFPTDLVGWTVFQRRMDGSVEFYRRWEDYAKGFGNPEGEFWLGLRKISQLMKQGSYELRVDMQDFDGSWKYAYYNHFHVGEEHDSFPLTTSGYKGNAGNDLQKSNVMFSALDRDHDQIAKEDCAELYKGAWWYGYGHCHNSNLNGQYLKGQHSSFADGVNWVHFRGYYYSLKYTEMKMRLKP